MDTAQERMDAGAKALMKLIRHAEKGAEEACEAGDAGTAERLHMMAGHMRIAYGIGRGIRTDGGIAPAFGGGKG
jgi:hypothetical protein